MACLRPAWYTGEFQGHPELQNETLPQSKAIFGRCGSAWWLLPAVPVVPRHLLTCNLFVCPLQVCLGALSHYPLTALRQGLYLNLCPASSSDLPCLPCPRPPPRAGILVTIGLRSELHSFSLSSKHSSVLPMHLSSPKVTISRSVCGAHSYTLALREVEVRGSGVQSQPRWESEFKASLVYLKPCQRTNFIFWDRVSLCSPLLSWN